MSDSPISHILTSMYAAHGGHLGSRAVKFDLSNIVSMNLATVELLHTNAAAQISDCRMRMSPATVSSSSTSSSTASSYDICTRQPIVGNTAASSTCSYGGNVSLGDDVTRLASPDRVAAGDSYVIACSMDVDTTENDGYAEDDLDAEVSSFLRHAEESTIASGIGSWRSAMGHERREDRTRLDCIGVDAVAATNDRDDRCDESRSLVASESLITEKGSLSAASMLAKGIFVKRLRRPPNGVSSRKHYNGCQVTADDVTDYMRGSRPYLNFDKMQKNTLHILSLRRKMAKSTSLKFQKNFHLNHLKHVGVVGQSAR